MHPILSIALYQVKLGGDASLCNVLKGYLRDTIYFNFDTFVGFGQEGPYKDRAGYDVIAASIGGLMHITGPKVKMLS